MSECLLQGHQGPRKTENVLHLLGVMGGAGAHICKHQAVVGMYPHLCHQLHSPPALPPPVLRTQTWPLPYHHNPHPFTRPMTAMEP